MPYRSKALIRSNVSGQIVEEPVGNIGSADVRENLIDIIDSHDPIQVYSVKEFLASGNDTISDAVPIRDTIGNASGDFRTVYFPPGRYKISSGLVFSENLVYKFAPGAILSIDAGVTGWIEGKIDAGKYHIFSGAGQYKFESRNKYHALVSPTDYNYTGSPMYDYRWNLLDGSNPKSETIGHITSHNTTLYPEWFGAKINGNSLTQARLNSLAVQKLIDSVSDAGQEMTWDGYLYTSGTIEFPNRTKPNGLSSPIPFGIVGKAGTTVLINYATGVPAININNTSGYAYDYPGDAPWQRLHDLMVISQHNGVMGSGVGKFTSFINLEVVCCKGPYGIYIRDSYGFKFDEVKTTTNYNHGTFFQACNTVDLFLTSRDNSGVGLVLQDCLEIRGDAYCESNHNYGISGNNAGGIDLGVWFENNNYDLGALYPQSYWENSNDIIRIRHNSFERYGTHAICDPISTCMVMPESEYRPYETIFSRASGLGYKVDLPPLFPSGLTGVAPQHQRNYQFSGSDPNGPSGNNPTVSENYYASGYRPTASGEILNGERVVAINILPGTHNHRNSGIDSTSAFLELYPYVVNSAIWPDSSGHYNAVYNSGDWIIGRIKISLDNAGVQYWRGHTHSSIPFFTHKLLTLIGVGDANYLAKKFDILPEWFGFTARCTATSSGNRLFFYIPDSTNSIATGINDPPTGYKMYIHGMELYHVPRSF